MSERVNISLQLGSCITYRYHKIIFYNIENVFLFINYDNIRVGNLVKYELYRYSRYR